MTIEKNTNTAEKREFTSMEEKQMTTEQWLAIRKEAGLHIDPETAEVMWDYAQTLDPYGIEPDLPEEYRQIGREYFARSPGSEVWVWFGDLPAHTEEALWKSISPNWRSRQVLRKQWPQVMTNVDRVDTCNP
jgi:hypothetical protein